MASSPQNAKTNPAKLAVLFGGSGFVGRHIAAALRKAGWKVRVAVRDTEKARHLKNISPLIEIVECNITSPTSIHDAMQGADAAVNCVGILAKNGAQNFDNIHVDGVNHISNAAKELDIAQLVHISAIGADVNGIASYAKTKGLGEQALLKNFPRAVILRPSIVFGPEDSFFNRFAAMAQLSPFLPAIGGGHTKFQPVFVDDIADAVVAALSGKAKDGMAYECGGPDVYSFTELLQRVGRYTQRTTIPVPLPFWFAKLLAIGTKPFPIQLRPITYDQVLLLKNDNVVSSAAISEARTLQGLGIDHPKQIDAIVPEYLTRFKN